jgi:hypothetical protein
VRLNEIAAKFEDKVQFLCVYIQEAHPSDGWQVEANLDDDVIYDAPTTMDEREALAEVCMLKLALNMPMVVDDMEDTIDSAFNALPERLYLLDAEGRVQFKTVAGSHGFDPEAWHDAIELHLLEEGLA